MKLIWSTVKMKLKARLAQKCYPALKGESKTSEKEPKRRLTDQKLVIK